MKSIGIVTIHNCKNNYGGALQCFGLYQYLKLQGFEVEVIDFHRPTDADYIGSIRFRNMRSHLDIRSFVKGWIKELLGIRRLSNPHFRPNWNPKAGERFARFNAQVKMSAPFCHIPDLYKNPPRYDVYISGSDQLWNPTQPYCLEPYFLTFVKDKKAHKISYGTSIGLSDISDREKKVFRKWLSSYDRISVREQQACRILEPVTGRTIHRVPDPTFLLEPDDWIRMSVAPPSKQDYVLVFNLGKDENIIRTAKRIARERNCKVKVIDQNYPFPDDPLIEVVADAGPLEFIGLIRDAWLVLTNSFHCTVFSLITGTRNFYTYIAPDSERGSRIVDLLDTFQLSDHIVNSMDAIPSGKILADTVIDTIHTRRIMKEEQQIGRKFLEESLNNTKNR